MAENFKKTRKNAFLRFFAKYPKLNQNRKVRYAILTLLLLLHDPLLLLKGERALLLSSLAALALVEYLLQEALPDVGPVEPVEPLEL